MKLQQLKNDFAVCKLTSATTVDVTKMFTFLSVTDDEISLVCDASNIPSNTVEVEKGWRGLKICGILDFGMVGVIAKISGVLAEQEISIFVVSTYNTDYIMLKTDHYMNAIKVLRENGYIIT